jgi:hypothetical protein
LLLAVNSKAKLLSDKEQEESTEQNVESLKGAWHATAEIHQTQSDAVTVFLCKSWVKQEEGESTTHVFKEL